MMILIRPLSTCHLSQRLVTNQSLRKVYVSQLALIKVYVSVQLVLVLIVITSTNRHQSLRVGATARYEFGTALRMPWEESRVIHVSVVG